MGAERFAVVSTAMAMKEPLRGSGEMRDGAFEGTVVLDQFCGQICDWKQMLTFVAEGLSWDDVNPAVFHAQRGVRGGERVAGGKLREHATNEACCRDNESNHFGRRTWRRGWSQIQLANSHRYGCWHIANPYMGVLILAPSVFGFSTDRFFLSDL